MLNCIIVSKRKTRCPFTNSDVALSKECQVLFLLIHDLV